MLVIRTLRSNWWGGGGRGGDACWLSARYALTGEVGRMLVIGTLRSNWGGGGGGTHVGYRHATL